MVGINQTAKGYWRCNFCAHVSWKTQAGAMDHAEQHHPKDLEIERLTAYAERLRHQPPKIEVREKIVEKVVYKEKPEAKYYYPAIAGIFCTSCKQVQRSVGIPLGQTIANTPHHCGNRTIIEVLEIR